MAKNNKKEYKFWNGKNIDGGSAVGNRDLINESPRTNPTEAKYEVGNETVAADNLQKRPQNK